MVRHNRKKPKNFTTYEYEQNTGHSSYLTCATAITQRRQAILNLLIIVTEVSGTLTGNLP